MAIGIVNDDDFNLEIDKCNTVPSKPIIIPEVIPIERGRGKGNVAVPESLQKIIGEESNINGRQEAIVLAQSFGISPSSVSAYANGAASTSTYNETKPSIRQHINAAKERISKKARGKLLAALNEITPDKLKEVTKLRDISGIAKDLSGIVRDMEPAKEELADTSNRPTFVFYSPSFKKEEHFETIILNE